MRFTLTVLSALIALCVSIGTPLNAFAAKTIKIAYTNFPEHPQGVAFAKFKERLEERSKGAFKVDLIGSGKYGNPDSIVKGLQMGVLQIGAESTSNFSVFDQRLMLFDMPYLVPNYEAAELLLNSEIGKELSKGLEKNGCLPMGYMELGFRHTFSTSEINNLAEAKSLKIRATPSKIHIATLRSLGMNPTPMAWGEVVTGLQQGTVDGIDIDINLGWFWRFFEVTKNLTLSGHIYTPHLVLMSKRFWNSLNPEEQKLVSETMTECLIEQRQLSRSNEAAFLEKFQSDYGMKVIELPMQEKAKWIDSAKNVPDEFKDIVPPALVDSVVELFKKENMYK